MTESRRTELRNAAPLILAIILGLASWISPTAQAPPSGRDQRLSVEYRRLVNAYRGSVDSVVADVAGMSSADLEMIQDAIFSAAPPEGPWTPAELEAAVVLHGDAALSAIETAPETGNFQLHYGSVFLYRLGPRHRALAVSWYVALAGMLRARALLLPVESLLELGRKRVPDAPPILFESALIAELQASFAATAGGRGTPLQRRAVWLGQADSWLRKAVLLDSANQHARLHLGRVQTLRDHHDSALKTLEPLLSNPNDTATRYLAALFMGAVHDRQGELASAEAYYRRAVEQIPVARSARVAIAELVQRRGRLTDSQAQVRALVESGSAEPDPWLYYLRDRPNVAEDRWLALRRRVRR